MPGYVQPKGTTGPSAPFAGKQSFDDAIRGPVVLDVAWMHGAPFAERTLVDERLAYLKPMFEANLERLLQ